MFSSTALEVALGLIFIYLVLSIICTGLAGATATATGLRARFLYRYVNEFTEGLARDIYHHPLLVGLVRIGGWRYGRSQPVDDDLRPRSYPARMAPGLFAVALFDRIIPGGLYARYFVPGGFDYREDRAPEERFEILTGRWEGLPSWERHPSLEGHPRLEAMLGTVFFQVAQGQPDRLILAVSELFEYGTELVDERVRTWTRVYLWGWALAVTIALNIDTVYIAESLWDQANGVALESIPVGWSSATTPGDLGEGISKAIGWLLTAGAVSFGSDFWLGLLERLGGVRRSEDKKKDEKEKKRD